MSGAPRITIGELEHKGEKRVGLFFTYDPGLIELVKTIPGRRWSPDEKCWHFPFRPDYFTFLQRHFTGRAEVRRKTEVPQAYIDKLKLRRYSPQTLKGYTVMLKMFLEHYPDRDPAALTDEHIRQYLLYLVNIKKVSGSYQNQAVNAIKFYYEKVLGRPPKTYYLDLPRRERRLPLVLSEEEVAAILKQVTIQTHRTILYLIYSAGLRLSELINLKPADIDADRRVIIIREAKGKKDRVSLLSDKALQQPHAGSAVAPLPPPNVCLSRYLQGDLDNDEANTAPGHFGMRRTLYAVLH